MLLLIDYAERYKIAPQFDRRHVKAFCMFGYRQLVAEHINYMIASSITRLRLLIGPIAIAWFVIAVVVLTLKRMAVGWACTHVGEERGEFKPTCAYCDTASSVIFVARDRRTSSTHIAPDRPLGRMGHSVLCVACCYSALAQISTRCFSVEAPTTFHGASGERYSQRNALTATIASAQKVPALCLSVFWLCNLLLDYKSPESLAW